MARYTADVKMIASIYPGQALDIRRNYGVSRASDGAGAQRSTLYRLQPVPRNGTPYVIPIFDCFENVRDFVRQGGGPRQKYNSNPVPCEEIVADLLTQWVGGLHMIPQDPPAKPGIMEISPLQSEERAFRQAIGQINLANVNWAELQDIMPKPNSEELRQMRAQQTAYFEFFFNEGEKISRGDHAAILQWSNYTSEMRLAAQALGRQTQWSDPGMAADDEPCPFCKQLIPPQAFVCKWCNRTVKEIPAHLLKLMEQSASPKVQ